MSGAASAQDAPATMARIAAATHVGSVRERNEDSFGVSGLELRSGDGEVTAGEIALPVVSVVADGWTYSNVEASRPLASLGE